MKTLEEIEIIGGEYLLRECGYDCILNGDPAHRLCKEELEDIGFTLESEGVDVDYEFGTEKRYEVNWQLWRK